MEYFKVLNLNREPFSNSPDPDLFYESGRHLDCLHHLEISVRLKRGLNLVVGDVGTGKTTICRQLIRILSRDESIESHLLLDPYFKSASEALRAIGEMLTDSGIPDDARERDMKEALKQALFQKGVEAGKTVVLIIDEGQKMPEFLMEILRELLNYETNDHKLLQIVVFAQLELDERLKAYANFTDRVSLYYRLRPFCFREMRAMIRFRLNASGQELNTGHLFTFPAFMKIFKATGGYPRKVIHLCHQGLLMMIIQNRPRVNRKIITICIRRGLLGRSTSDSGNPAGKKAAVLFLTALLLWIGISSGRNILNAIQGGNSLPQPSKVAEETVKAFFPPEETKETSDAEKAEPPSFGPRPFRISYPEDLGVASVRKGETLGEMVKMVYGTSDPEVIEKVMQANPHLTSPHRVAIGQKILFPAIAPDSGIHALSGFALEMAEVDELEAGLDLLRKYRNQYPEPFCLIPRWTQDAGLTYGIFLNEAYPKKKGAHHRMQTFSSKDGIRIISLEKWENDAILFAIFLN